MTVCIKSKPGAPKTRSREWDFIAMNTSRKAWRETNPMSRSLNTVMGHVASAILTLAVAATTSVAFAHPLPRAASPMPNATLTSSPQEIRITFSEPLVAAFSGLELKDGAGAAVAVGAASVDPGDHKQLAAPVTAPLTPGTYTVSWHAVGEDTHHVSGLYRFVVKP
jgi:copper resistance protein C